MVADAPWEEISHLDGPQGRQHQMIGTPKGFPHELAPLECHHLGHPRGHASRHFNGLPPHWFGGIQGLATYLRYVAHLTLFIQREDAEGGTDRPLSQRTRPIDAAVHLPQLRGGPRVMNHGEVGFVPHLGRDLTDGQVPKHLAYTPVLPTAEEGKVRHRPFGDSVKGFIHTPDGRPYGRHATAVDGVIALLDDRPP